MICGNELNDLEPTPMPGRSTGKLLIGAFDSCGADNPSFTVKQRDAVA
ncbi:MAG: hypothetical protein GY826_14740 [Fuerstiella sp.]|nr:hypothetical protein [Fuerstiella sp.]